MFGLPFGRKEPPKNLLAKDEEIVEEKPKKPRKKKEPPKPWTTKDRIIVGVVLGATVGFGIYFWLKGNGTLSDFNVNIHFPTFEETIILK